MFAFSENPNWFQKVRACCSDSANPVVRDIRRQMREEFGQELVFRYPSDGDGLKILKKSGSNVAELTNGEKNEFM